MSELTWHDPVIAACELVETDSQIVISAINEAGVQFHIIVRHDNKTPTWEEVSSAGEMLNYDEANEMVSDLANQPELNFVDELCVPMAETFGLAMSDFYYGPGEDTVVAFNKQYSLTFTTQDIGEVEDVA